VTAQLKARGFAYSSDTDGAPDWRVAVSVRDNTTQVADFAGIGKGQLVGSGTGRRQGAADQPRERALHLGGLR
jgi:hypothetical protein